MTPEVQTSAIAVVVLLICGVLAAAGPALWAASIYPSGPCGASERRRTASRKS
jgi:hypothetical protein